MPTITTVDATWTNAMTMDEAELRRADTTMFLGNGTANGVRGGVVRHGDTSLAVSVNGSDQVTVQPGAAVIPAATGLGAHRTSLPAATAATGLTARNATNPRIDLIVIQMVSGAAVVRTVDGTPSSSPSAPALPASSIELARVTVPPVGGGAVTVDSTWRAYATGLGGTLYVETAARLPGSGNQKGQPAFALDTGRDYAWNGTAWVLLNVPGGTLGYAQVTENQGTITAAVDLTGLTVSVTAGASRRLLITAQGTFFSSVAGDFVGLFINEGATVLNQTTAHMGAAGSGQGITISAVITPTAGAHTYKLRASRAAGTGIAALQAAAAQPAYILVQDIGAA